MRLPLILLSHGSAAVFDLLHFRKGVDCSAGCRACRNLHKAVTKSELAFPLHSDLTFSTTLQEAQPSKGKTCEGPPLGSYP